MQVWAVLCFSMYCRSSVLFNRIILEPLEKRRLLPWYTVPVKYIDILHCSSKISHLPRFILVCNICQVYWVAPVKYRSMQLYAMLCITMYCSIAVLCNLIIPEPQEKVSWDPTTLYHSWTLMYYVALAVIRQVIHLHILTY